MARVRSVAHIQVLIERVGEDAPLWEAVMKNILLNAELWTIAMRSRLFPFHDFFPLGPYHWLISTPTCAPSVFTSIPCLYMLDNLILEKKEARRIGCHFS